MTPQQCIAARAALKLTRAELAAKAGESDHAIASFENGRSARIARSKKPSPAAVCSSFKKTAGAS